jgi:outer membrane protein assembly factor BamB
MVTMLRAVVLMLACNQLADSAWRPRVVWSRDLGEGYAGFVLASDRLVTMYRRGLEEVVVALEAETGRTLWEYAYAAAPLKGQDLSQGPGPHAAPTLAGENLVCCAGVTGRLTCLDRASGRVRWTKELVTDLGGTAVYRGYSSTPVRHRDTIIAQVGGDGRALIAFDAQTGRERWRGGSFANTNSSPIVIDAGGRHQVIAFMVDVIASLDAETGAQIWAHPHPQQYDDNITQPLWVGEERLLVVSSALDGGTRALEVGRDSARERWHQPRFGTYYTNLIPAGRVLAASSGGATTSVFMAVDRATGSVLWQSRDVARANGVTASGGVILRDEQGALVITRVDAAGVVVERRAQLLEAGAPSPPLVDGSRVYMRDRTRAMAVDIGS